MWELLLRDQLLKDVPFPLLCFRQKVCEAFDEIITVLVRPKDMSSLNSPDHDVVEHACGVESGLSWHILNNIKELLLCQLNYSRTSPTV